MTSAIKYERLINNSVMPISSEEKRTALPARESNYRVLELGVELLNNDCEAAADTIKHIIAKCEIRIAGEICGGVGCISHLDQGRQLLRVL